MQRKLDGFEKHWITSAATSIRALMVGCGCEHRWDEQFADLLAVADNGTTDGKPWIEPQPEIGDGYRPAAEADKDRQDRQAWNFDTRKWQPALHGSSSSAFYRVPVDRIPTDEDARQRPTVMVRDNDKQDWQARKLLAVPGCLDEFIASSSSGVACFWKQARFPCPGELD